MALFFAARRNQGLGKKGQNLFKFKKRGVNFATIFTKNNNYLHQNLSNLLFSIKNTSPKCDYKVYLES